MNKLVQVALSKPYTFVVLAILIVVFGALDGGQAADRRVSKYPDARQFRRLAL